MQNRLRVVLWAVIWLLIPTSGTVAPLPAAQQAADQKGSQNDSYQRSTNIYTYNVRAKSGPARGEELYYYKCWFCHNQYVKIGPQLGELYKRGTFASSGDEVTDRNVAAKIQEGGPGMPSFRTTMKEPDISDLVSYIKSGNCCFNSQDPPPNARYRGGKQ
jgi:hypothetical protein